MLVEFACLECAGFGVRRQFFGSAFKTSLAALSIALDFNVVDSMWSIANEDSQCAANKLMNAIQKEPATHSKKRQAPTRPCQCRGVRWTVGIGPWPIRRFGMSALLLLQQRSWRSNLDAKCQPRSRPAVLRPQPPHQVLFLSLRWITSFLVLSRILSTSRFGVKKKVNSEHN